MSKHEPDPVYVRASVHDHCNLRCQYCDIEGGMENRVPARLAGQWVTTAEYVRHLAAIARAGIAGVSFTGGEPTLRDDLGDIIVAARPHFSRVELTTNGVRLARCADAVRDNVDLLKVSLDSRSRDRVTQLTMRSRAYGDAVQAITWALEESVPLAINVVLMRQTLDELDELIAWCATLAGAATAPVHLSLLDFYYSPSRRQEWMDGFVPTSEVIELLADRYGAPTEHARFGCSFYWFDVDGLSVRLKDSYSATMRATKCLGCTSYCQEGVYGIKHSVEGWLTTCPSSREDLGVHLAAGLNEPELDARIHAVLAEVTGATPVHDSFARMCEIQNLPSFAPGPPLPMTLVTRHQGERR